MATIPTIGFYGERLDLRIRQGATFGPVLATMMNPDRVTPVDLTGCVIRGQIRRKALDATVIATLECSITDAINGQYQFGLSETITVALAAGDTPEDPKSQYVWDLEMVDAAGRILPLYFGKVSVLREVTRG